MINLLENIFSPRLHLINNAVKKDKKKKKTIYIYTHTFIQQGLAIKKLLLFKNFFFFLNKCIIIPTKNIKLQNNYINDWVSVIFIIRIIRIILEWFLKNHVDGVMMLKVRLWITYINYILNYIQMDNGSLIILNITVLCVCLVYKLKNKILLFIHICDPGSQNLLSCWCVFVVIAKNALYGSKL